MDKDKVVDLDKIIDDLGNINRDESGNRVFYAWEIKDMMKEVCNQILELASENVKIKIVGSDSDVIGSYVNGAKVIDKQSILDTINQVK